MEVTTMPDGWERLTCLCGQNRFAPMVHLRWRNGGGITQEQAGYFCLECHGVADGSSMIQRAQVAARRRELREMESELAENVPVAAAPMKSKDKK